MLLRLSSRLLMSMKPTIKYFIRYHFATFNLQQQKLNALNLLDTIKSSKKQSQLQFSKYHEHQLFQQLQKLQSTSKLSSTILTQSLNYFTEDRYIHPVLYMLYPHIASDKLSDSALIFIFQKILAYKPKNLPQIPSPRMITNNQMLFFILCELYEPKKLIGWLDKVAFWSDTNQSITVFSIAVFTLYNKMSKQERETHAKKVKKAINVIDNNLVTEFGDELISILILALQLSNPYAQKIISQKIFHLEQLPHQQLCMVFVNMAKYSPSDSQKSKIIEEKLQQLAQYIVQIDWKRIKSISIMDMWQVMHSRSSFKGIWMGFLNKLTNQTQAVLLRKQSNQGQQSQQVEKFTPSNLVFMIQTMDKHFINKKQLLHQILHKLEPSLTELSTQDLVKLVRSMATYVKLEEGYFLHLRKICDKRKFQFSNEEVKELRKVYSRFGVLFSIPF